ncbi:GNAT family N-acetyltransferase [Kordia sp. YSTF-M3]|uniref:GNAT family N-acetyltransferase n=1 Tax=Kordia aestuariivivens TaxID=2759037 RepID=A0ABR7Q4K1_9FLAO|nr:GNAT family N-acetyltransferase [Kordia aestuariivivens]MBC8753490.1 GNAT family N-acetyltransferase [Kordia aestuariivivens]
MKDTHFIIKEITAKTAYNVRHPVLREGKPIDSCRFDGDDLPTTFHLGYYIDTQLVGVVTLLEKAHPQFTSENPFQLRGMAVLTNFQKRGIGDALVKKAEEMILARGGTAMWMNAREIAVRFYEKLGYEKYGEPFTIPKIGLHFIMVKTF